MSEKIEVNKKIIERMKAVKAMEFLARQVNDGEVFDIWALCGVADGDIKYGDLVLDGDIEKDEAYEYASDDDTFASLMEVFLRLMCGAHESGGLYCGGVQSE